MTTNYSKPNEMLAGQVVYPADWNKLVTNQWNLNDRLIVLENSELPDPDYSSFPIGGIIAFYKAASLIPAGWQICDGTNGTPDLRSRFIRGASQDADLGVTGGSETHTHSNPSTNSAGAHSHTVSGGSSPASSSFGAASGSTSAAAGGHTHNVNIKTGTKGDHSHNVGATGSASTLPPYVMLYYIMRLS